MLIDPFAKKMTIKIKRRVVNAILIFLLTNSTFQSSMHKKKVNQENATKLDLS